VKILRVVMALALMMVLMGLGTLSILGKTAWSEYRAGAPTSLTLEDFEDQDQKDQPRWVDVGEHVALYPYALTMKDPDTGKEYVLYPVASKSNRILEQRSKMSTSDGIQKMPSLKDVAVLVKTYRFESAGDVPKKPLLRKKVEGVFIQGPMVMGKVDRKVREFPATKYKGLDFDSIAIIEEGREPSLKSDAVGLAFGIFCLVSGGVLGILFFKLKREV
jgi:hypothetical protein